MYSTDFPQVQDDVLGYVGHGVPQPNVRGRMLPRGIEGRGASPTGSKADRANKLKEGDGPRCYIQATLYKPNAAEASSQPRAVRIMPSAAGVSDFWSARSGTGQPYV